MLNTTRTSTSNENLMNAAAIGTETTSAAAASSSPNRSKYEKKFFKKSLSSSISGSRKPLAEKTKVIGNVSQNSSSVESLPRTIEFEDLFFTQGTPRSINAKKNTTSSGAIAIAADDTSTSLKLALSESLLENEQLTDTVKLLKLEIERLQRELVDSQEYAELYLLSKELIEQQAQELASLKKRFESESQSESESEE
jgi:hypothetical protein